jgi:hypothetical protein
MILSFFNFFLYVKKKKKTLNGSGGSPAGDPRHDPLSKDKRVINGPTHLRPKPVKHKPKPANFVSFRVGFTGRVKIVGPN